MHGKRYCCGAVVVCVCGCEWFDIENAAGSGRLRCVHVVRTCVGGALLECNLMHKGWLPISTDHV